MERYTTQQVNEQKQRFENLLSSCNLVKAGKKIVNISIYGEWYEVHNFVSRYLALHNISHCMYYSIDPNVFYSDAFKNKAIDAYLKSLK